MEAKKCDCLLFFMYFDYEGYHPVHRSELGSWNAGDDQYYFNFCPLCGKEIIDRPQ